MAAASPCTALLIMGRHPCIGNYCIHVNRLLVRYLFSFFSLSVILLLSFSFLFFFFPSLIKFATRTILPLASAWVTTHKAGGKEKKKRKLGEKKEKDNAGNRSNPSKELSDKILLAATSAKMDGVCHWRRGLRFALSFPSPSLPCFSPTTPSANQVPA